MKILQLLDETSKAAIMKNLFVDYLVIDESKIISNKHFWFLQNALINARAYKRGTKNSGESKETQMRFHSEEFFVLNQSFTLL